MSDQPRALTVEEATLLFTELQQLRARDQQNAALLSALQQQQPAAAELRSIKVPEPAKYDGSRTASTLNEFVDTVESYVLLRYPSIPAASQVLAVGLLLSGAARDWFRIQSKQEPFTDVADLLTRLKRQFLPHNHQRLLRDELARCSQHTTVPDYASRFQNILLQLEDVSREEALDRFLRGLKPQTRVQTLVRDPQSLEEAVRVATTYDAIMFAGRPAPDAYVPVPMDLSQVSQATVATTEHSEDHLRAAALDAFIQAFDIRLGGNHRPARSQPPPANPARSTPTKLTPAIRQWCMENAACFYCRQPQAGHTAATCPARPAPKN